MNFINYYDSVYYAEDFLLPEEIEYILKEVDSLGEQDWHTDDLPENAFWQNRIYTKLNGAITTRIEERILNLFSSYSLSIQFHSVLRLKKSDSMAYHIDNGKDVDVKFGVVVYINDNYSGGEISYPDLNLKIKPKSGSIALHRNNILHGIEEVTQGTRYAMTTFIHGTEEKEAKFKYE